MQLDNDEIILYKNNSNTNKTSNHIFRFIIFILVLICIMFILINGISKDIVISEKISILFILIIDIIFICLLLYGLINNLFLKKAINNENIITNKRIIVKNNSGILFKNISDINYIGITRIKGIFADLIFGFNIDNDDIMNNIINNKNNTICFYGIENYNKVIKIVKKINSNIYIYDDKPKILGKKYNWM